MDYTIASGVTAIGSGDTAPVSGTEGEFTEGNPATSTPATVLPGYQMNAIVQEIRNSIVAAGLTPSRTNNAQLAAALAIVGTGQITKVSATTPLTRAEAGLILIDASAGSVTLTLPLSDSSATLALRYQFMRTDVSGNTVSVITAGSDTWLNNGASGSMTVTLGRQLSIVNDGVSVWVALAAGPRNAQGFTSSGTYTTGPNQFVAWLTGVAPGGGGAGSYAVSPNFSAGGAGSSGQPALKQAVTVAPNTGYSVTIGSPGAAGAIGVNGSSGGALSFSGLLTLTGGSGGVAGTIIGAGTGGASVAAGSIAGEQGMGFGAAGGATMTFPGGRGGTSPFGGYGVGGDGGGVQGSGFSPGAGNAGGAGILIVEG